MHRNNCVRCSVFHTQDVEANTVRLKEHGQDVLVLEKIPANIKSADGSVQVQYKYYVLFKS